MRHLVLLRVYCEPVSETHAKQLKLTKLLKQISRFFPHSHCVRNVFSFVVATYGDTIVGGWAKKNTSQSSEINPKIDCRLLAIDELNQWFCRVFVLCRRVKRTHECSFMRNPSQLFRQPNRYKHILCGMLVVFAIALCAFNVLATLHSPAVCREIKSVFLSLQVSFFALVRANSRLKFY